MVFLSRFIAFFFFVYAMTVHAEPLKVWGNEQLPPMGYLTDGKPAGFGVEITKAVLDKAGIEYEVNLAPWARAYEEAKNGNGAVFGMYWTEERSVLFDYTFPLWQEDIVIVTKKGKEFPFNSIEDLRGRVIAYQKGTRPGTAFERSLKLNMFIGDPDNYPPARLQKILLDRVDAGVFNPGLAAVVWNSKKGNLPVNQFTVLEKPLATKYKHIAILKSETSEQFIKTLDKAIEALKESDAINRIMQSYH